MAFSGSNGATGTCVIASDGSVKITPYGKAVSQYETITVPIYYECFILGKHTARNGVAGISPPRREFQKC